MSSSSPSEPAAEPAVALPRKAPSQRANNEAAGSLVATRVTIVIPALNEAGAVGGVVERLRNQLPGAEVLVVNDGSTDGTDQVASRAGARVVSHDRCRGYGAGLRTGVETSERDFVLFCDADGQHTVEDVARLIDAWDGHDMVVGARGADSHAPMVRRPGKAVLRWFTDFLAGEKIPDFNSGLRLIRRDVLRRYLHLMPTGFSFSTTSTFAMLKTNRRIKWVPIHVKKRVGESTVRQWKHGPQTLMLVMRLSVLFEPLKVFLWVAAFLFAASILSLTFDLVLTFGLLGGTGGTGLNDTTVLLSVATVLVFLFGLLCDQVSAMRREMHDRPSR